MGVGTTSPAAKLDVRGDVKLGSSGELFAPGGEETLRIVRGRVTQSGVRDAGSGFTVARVDTGFYNITFATPFPDGPTIAATPRGGPVVIGVVGSSGNSATIITYVDGVPRDRPFDFIAMGPR